MQTCEALFWLLFLLHVLLKQQGVAPISLQTSAPLTATSNSNASTYALFGGQGTNEVYFDELQTLYNLYKPYVSHLITAITNEVLVTLAAAHVASGCYNYDMDVTCPWTIYYLSRVHLSLLPSHWINSAHSVPCCSVGIDESMV